jgi:hypothetical protein
LKSKFSDLEVALAASIKALAAFKDAAAESKNQFSSAHRKPEQGSRRGGCGDESGEVEALQQSGLPEHIAGSGD